MKRARKPRHREQDSNEGGAEASLGKSGGGSFHRKWAKAKYA